MMLGRSSFQEYEAGGIIPIQRGRNQATGGISHLGYVVRHNSLGHKNVDWNEADSKLEREQLGGGIEWPVANFLPPFLSSEATGIDLGR